MGAWDVGIFDNDTSADVRGIYEDALAADEATATARVLDRMAEDVAEPECAPDVWLALAGAQWDYGRLEPEVLAQALATIDDGRDVERWRLLGASDEDVGARAEALREFRERITAPQPAPSKPVPAAARPPLPATPYVVGDVLAHRLPSGAWLPLVVIQVARTLTSGAAPVCVVFERAFPEPPTMEEVMALDIAEDPHHEQWMLVCRHNDRPVPSVPPPEVTLRALMLWMVEDEAEDAEHREQAVRVLGRAPIAFTLVGHVERLGWRELSAFAQRRLGVS